LPPGRARSPDDYTVPEPLTYRLKNLVLGKPVVSERLAQERLSTPIAIGVLAPTRASCHLRWPLRFHGRPLSPSVQTQRSPNRGAFACLVVPSTTEI
jgi:hypothetical protein